MPRLLLAATSAAWLLGSLSPWLLLAHQGALLLVLLAVPTGRIEGVARWVGALSVPIALGMLAQPVVGLILCLVGSGALRRGRTPDRLGVAAAGLLVGGALLGAWSVSRSGGSFDPDVAVLVYEAAVVAAAAALVLGSRAAWNRQRDLMDRLVMRSGQTGVLGLAEVLAEMLRAPGLEIGGTALELRHPALDSWDDATREGVQAAVRLVAQSDERRAALDQQVTALRTAQRRMVFAQDEQRELTARRLRDEVVAPLRTAAIALADEATPSDDVAASSLGVALDQIRAAADDVEEIVHGAVPVGLGTGGLADAVRAMAARSPVAVELHVDGPVSARRVRRVHEGECVIDPTIVARLLSRRRRDSPLERLTEREHEILGLMAEGRSNAGIAVRLHVSERTVEAACAQVFRKLDLDPDRDSNRRVLAVLSLLRA